MKVGFHLPQWGPTASRSAVLAVAKVAEAAQLDSVWVADHIVYPTASDSRYPYRSKGLPFSASEGFLEAITQLSVVAGATEHIRLGTSVLVLPMREPLLAAKMMTTLDVLSGGRAVIAVGAGWWQEEFDAVSAPFARRGARLDEQLAILKAAWQQGTFDYHGENYEFAEVSCLPLPIQPGGPPVLIGGNGPVSWKRAGRAGDGWHAVGIALDALKRGVEQVRLAADSVGRDPARLEFSVSTGMSRSAAQTVERLGALRDIGMTQAVLNTGAGGNELGAYLNSVETLADSVLPQIRSRLASSPRAVALPWEFGAGCGLSSGGGRCRPVARFAARGRVPWPEPRLCRGSAGSGRRVLPGALIGRRAGGDRDDWSGLAREAEPPWDASPSTAWRRDLDLRVASCRL